jgi:hypothetical protein
VNEYKKEFKLGLFDLINQLDEVEINYKTEFNKELEIT